MDPLETLPVCCSRHPIVGLLAGAMLLLGMAQGVAGQTPPGESVAAWHVTLAPSWFDPSTAPPQITPFGLLYAIHDALLRPLAGQKMGNSLAESWKESPDGLTYEFKLRPGLKFPNGDPLTTEDVRFSFERYKGAGSRPLQERVRQVEILDPLTVRFRLKEPWPDFLTFYGTSATAAGIVVPKKSMTDGGRPARGRPHDQLTSSGAVPILGGRAPQGPVADGRASRRRRRTPC
jgi:peptide/nickel transport system substrate-binding protein